MSNKCAVDIELCLTSWRIPMNVLKVTMKMLIFRVTRKTTMTVKIFLNTNIREEVLAAVTQLKKDKVACNDRVLNVQISSTVSIFLSLYTKLFQILTLEIYLTNG